MGEDKRVWQKYWTLGVTGSFEITQPISEYLRDISEKKPDRTALHFYGTQISYQVLNEKIDRFARALIELGLQKGDRVAIQMPNCPQFVICFFGILRAGGVVVAINPMFKAAELEYEFTDATPKVFICIDYLYQEVTRIKTQVALKHIIVTSLKEYAPQHPIVPLPDEFEIAAEDLEGTIAFQDLLKNAPNTPVCRVNDLENELALLQYTGGTSGLPKGAMISHHSLSLAVLGANNWFSMAASDCCLGVTPFFHIMGMIQVMCSPLSSGAELVVLTRFVPQIVAGTIQTYHCTAWVGATTMLIALLQLPDIETYDFSSLRYVVSGGAPISVDIQTRFSRLIPQAAIVEGYGLTESISQGAAITPIGGYRSGFVGVPHLNDIKIVDSKNGHSEMPPGEPGEIVLKGKCLMKGYWQRPQETERVFRDGWLHTGDIGAMNDKGYLTVSGRNKEMIKCSGYSVFPDEVEKLMYRHEAVAEVAVVGVPDDYRGESAKAFVVLTPGYLNKITEKEVFDWCKENMAAYKCPRQVTFLETLPKSAAGKVLRRLLK